MNPCRTRRNAIQLVPLVALLLAAPLSACDTSAIENIRNMKLTDLKSALPGSDDMAGAIKISDDATIPIYLSSNKSETVFTVNGKPLNPARMLKVVVPKGRLEVTAWAPCYRTLRQSAEENGFSYASKIEFFFALRDKEPGASGSRCT